jgi:predicted nuclease with TOPRIM domain
MKAILALERRVEELVREYNELREAFSIMDARVRVVENRLLELEAEQAAINQAAGRVPGSEAGLIAGSVTQVTRQDSETGKPETRLVLPGPTRLQ